MNKLFLYVTVLLLGIISGSMSARADTLDLLCCSHHFSDNKYNEQNYGLMYENTNKYTNGKIVAGIYKNSMYKTTAYIGAGEDWQLSKNIKTSVAFVVATGYNNIIIPAFLPSITLYDTITIYGIPIDGGVVALSIRLGVWQ